MFHMLIELERRKKCTERNVCGVYLEYAKVVLPSDECTDLEEWKNAAKDATIDAWNNARHAANVVNILSSGEQAFFQHLLAIAPHPLISKFLTEVLNGTLAAGEKLNATKAAIRAGNASKDRREPLREFARAEARLYCAEQDTKPSRLQCVKKITPAIRSKAKELGMRLFGDEAATWRTVDGWIKDMPDAGSLFKVKPNSRPKPR